MAANVQVILARDVPNLGRIGELVGVRPGYARNFLVPQGLALPASPKRVAEFDHKRRLVEHQRSKLREASQARASELTQVQVTINAKVGEQDKLFGSITSRDISRALAAVGHNIHHRDIKLEGPLKDVGLHTIDVRLEADVTAQIKVIVVADVVVPDVFEAEGPTAEDREVAQEEAEGEAELAAEEAAQTLPSED